MKPYFTPREIDVLNALITGGGSSKHIARQTGLAVGTVKVHLKFIALKLDMQGRGRIAIALWWQENRPSYYLTTPPISDEEWPDHLTLPRA